MLLRRSRTALLLSWFCAAAWLSACAPEQSVSPPQKGEPRDAGADDDEPSDAEAQLRRLCSRGRTDAVTDVFCRDPSPSIHSLAELQTALGLGFEGNIDPPSVVVTTNSSSLVAKTVSSINPRVILFRDFSGAPPYGLALAFSRGEPLVEIIAFVTNEEFHFYLVRYERECTERGCGPEEMFTPATESGWTRLSLFDDVDLRNTPLDCLACHQPEGPGTIMQYIMRERTVPWTHWFAADPLTSEGGPLLAADYLLAHRPDEVYGGVPGEALLASRPNSLEVFIPLVMRGSGDFASSAIESEVRVSNPAQPADNSLPGQSAIWSELYDRGVRGEVNPPPYHDVKITEPAALTSMSAAYRSFMSGTLEGAFPDLSAVIRPEARISMSLVPRPGAPPREILVHMCATCHNERLDQSLSRARFDPFRLDEMSRQQKDVAIERLLLPVDDPLRMPPHLLRDLSPEEIEACIDELER